ncbi:MAG: tellurite resistance TerB family protein, partial [Pseudomonadota bacterium]
MAEAVVRLTPEEAIIYIMVLASASDGRMSPKELRMIGRVVRTLSMFDGFDEEELVSVSERCGALMASEGGLHKVLEAAKAALPSHLNETA